jgi:hypothetical protein
VHAHAPSLSSSDRASTRSECLYSRRARGCLKAIAAADREAAVRWLGRMPDELVDAFSKPQKHDLVGVDQFISLADELNAFVLDAVIERIDIKSARVSWTARWDDARESTRSLLQRVSRVPGTAAMLATSMLGTSGGDEADSDD